MQRFSLALAIFALAICACAPILPMQKAELPTQTPTALAIPTRAIKATATPQTAEVTAAQSLNVRVRPGEQSAVTGYLYHGDVIQLSGRCQTGWAEIVWKQSVAWVNSNYLSENKCQANKE
jgi:uncharacterized protein YgiM (DUF1202 family)